MNSLFRIFALLSFCLSVQSLGAVSVLHLENVETDETTVTSTTVVSASELHKIRIQIEDCLKISDWDTAYHVAKELLEKDDASASIGLRSLLKLESEMMLRHVTTETWESLELTLGRYYISQQPQNRNQAWVHWQRALDYWSESTDLDIAQASYIQIVRDAVSFTQSKASADMTVNVPLSILQSILAISNDSEDKAFAYFYLAERHLKEVVNFSQSSEVKQYFEMALELGDGADWYERALYLYGKWLMRSGYSYFDDNGDFQAEPDYSKAVEVLTRLKTQTSGEKTFYSQKAEILLNDILKPRIHVDVRHSYHPDTEMECSVEMTNIPSVSVNIYPISLVSDCMVDDEGLSVDLNGVEPLRSFTLSNQAEREHYTASEKLSLGQDLPMGAYYIEAKGSGVTAHDILLISDASVILKHAKNQVLLYFCDSKDGSPIADASVTVWFSEVEEANGKNKWVGLSTKTNGDGIAFVAFSDEDGWSQRRVVWAALSKENRHAYVADQESYENGRFRKGLLNATLFSDKKTYSETDDEFSWSAILRYPLRGEYVYPKGYEISYRIIDENGKILGESSFMPEDDLSELGLIKGKLSGLSSLNSEQLYIEFIIDDLPRACVKLPLINRSVSEGKPLMTIRFNGDSTEPLHVVHPGEVLTGQIQLSGSVSGLSSQNVTLELFRERVDAFFEGVPESRELVKSQKVALDSIGAASFSYQLEREINSSYRYTVSVGLSAIQGEEAVSQEFYMVPTSYDVRIRPEKKLSTPEEPVRVNIHARNALGNGKMVQGNLRLLRQTWREVWVGRSGKQISGEELQELKESGGGWFSFGPSPSDYRLEEEGYVREQISQVRLMTDNQGDVEYYYEPLPPGYYVLRWIGRDSDGKPVKAESGFWIASQRETDIGYRSEGIDLVVDDCDAFQRKEVPALITGPNSDRWTLLVVGNDHIQDWKLIHPQAVSNVAFLDLSGFTGRNAFVEACSVSGDIYYSDLEEVLLHGSSMGNQVEVRSNTYGYEPAQTAQFSVTVKDASGRPVSDAAVIFQIKKRNGFEALRDGMLCQPLVPGVPYKVSEKVSLVDVPYFRPLVEDEKQSVYISEDKGNSPSLHYLLGTCAGNSYSSAQGEVTYWDSSQTTDADGKVLYDIPLVDQLGEWTATAAVITDSQCVRYGRSEFRTRLPMVAELAFPDSLSPGDVAVAKALIANNTFFNMNLKLSLDSGDLLKQLSFVNETGEVVDLKEVTIRDHYVSVPAKSSVDVEWNIVAEKTLSSERLKANLKLVAAMKNRVTSDVASCFIQAKKPNELLINAIASNKTLEIPFSLTDSQGLGEVSCQITSSVEPILHNSLLRLLGGKDVAFDRDIVALDDSFMGVLVAFNGIETLRSQGNHLALNRVLQQSGLSSEDLSILRESLLNTLRATVNPDGGWSWGQRGESDVGFSAYVLWTLVNFENASEPLLVGARNYLTRELVEKDLSMQMQAWLLRSLAAYNRLDAGRPTRVEARALISLMRRKSELGSQGIAFLALAAQDFGLSDEALELLKTLEDTGTKASTGIYWESPEQNAFWGSSKVETTAFALSAFLSIDPGHPMVEGIMTWLTQARADFSDWGSLRSTCIVLKMLGWYYSYTGDGLAQDQVTVSVNDKEWKRMSVNPASVVAEGLPQMIPSELLQEGENILKVSSGSNKPLLCALKLPNPDKNKKATYLSELSLSAAYFRMHRIPTLLKGFVSSVDSFDGQSSVSLGDRIQVIAKIHVDSPVSYMQWTIPYPSGFSIGGVSSSNTLRLYRLRQQEGEVLASVDTLDAHLEDDRFDIGASRILNVQKNAEGLVFLLDNLEPGEWEIHYSMVADAEGQFLLKPIFVEQVHTGVQAVSGDARSITVVSP